MSSNSVLRQPSAIPLVSSELYGQIEAIRRSHGVALFDMDGIILDANHILLNALGYTLEDVQGKHHRLFLTPEDANSQAYEDFWARLRLGEFQSAEFKRLGKNGKEVWFQATYTPIEDASGKPSKVVKIATEVTEQKLRSADSRGQLEAIRRSHAVATFSMDGFLVDANEIFLQSLGYNFADIRGKHHRTFVTKEEASSKEYMEFWESLNRGEFQTAEFKRIGNGGREVWLQAVYTPILDMNNKPYKVVKMATDVTEQKRRLAEADRGKSMFLANMSHEIRTPMNGIFGMLSLLKDTTLDKTARSYVDTCMRSAESLLAVLNDILLFSKANAGAIELERIPFNLNNTVEDVLHIVSSNVTPQQDVDVTHFVKPDVPMFLIGDESRLRQVLLNLLSNAVKFTKYGEISLDIAVQSKEPLMLRFDVSDTGIGISEQDQTRLFKPFSQADSSITRQFGGTGLGLAICQHLVHLFGGNLTVQSRLGRGSTFSFTAKFGLDTARRHDSLAAALDVAEDDFSLLKDLRVLVIDDNATNCIALETTMRAFGCVARSARSGPDGLDILKVQEMKGESIDLVLLDYHMPAMSGIDVARAIARSGLSPKIIALTSSIDKQLIQEPNISACTVKPVRRGQLLHMIRSTLASSVGPSPATSTDSVPVPPALLDSPPEHTPQLMQPPVQRQKRKLNGSDEMPLPPPPQRHTSLVEGLLLAGSCVLVAEDNETNRKVVSHFLSQVNCSVIEAVNGVEAVDKLTDDVKVVLMDVHMPILDGIAATRLLLQKRPRLPVVYLTADITEETKLRCRESGAVDVLLKPVNKTALLRALAAALQMPLQNNPLTLSSPLAVDLRRSATLGPPLAPLRVPSFRCLVVDDVQTNRVMLEHFVRKICGQDVQIFLADSGELALRHYADQPTQLIIIDVKMPNMNGMEVTRRIRRIPVARPAVIVGVTGLDDITTMKECKAAGMDAVLTKPVREEQLAPLIVLAREAHGIRRESSGQPIQSPLFNPTLTRDLPAPIRSQLLQDWRSTTLHQLSLLRGLLTKTDWENFAQIAHSMKGSSTQLGLERVGHAAATLLSTVRSSPREPVLLLRLLDELEHVLEGTLGHLNTIEPMGSNNDNV